MTLRKYHYLVVAQLVALLILPGGCEEDIEPGEITPMWGDRITNGMTKARKDKQEEGQIPATPCQGHVLSEGLNCPRTDESDLDSISTSVVFNSSFEMDTKWGKGNLNYEHSVALASTSNRSAQHDHQCVHVDTQECAEEYVQWRMVLNLTSTIKATVMIGTVLVNLNVNLGAIGTQSGLAFCRFVDHPDHRTCGPDQDEDGVPDEEDNCPETPNEDQQNSDSDPHGDDCDNCPQDDNEDQADSDGDGIGDVCDLCGNGQLDPDEPCDGDVGACPGKCVDCRCIIGTPVLPHWGLIALTVLLLTVGAIVFGRRRRREAMND